MEGKVAPVMNMGQCGATWMIPAVVAIEAAVVIADIAKSQSSCADYDNKTDNGCDKGCMMTAFGDAD